jgi:hypothetical protein
MNDDDVSALQGQRHPEKEKGILHFQGRAFCCSRQVSRDPVTPRVCESFLPNYPGFQAASCAIKWEDILMEIYENPSNLYLTGNYDVVYIYTYSAMIIQER